MPWYLSKAETKSHVAIFSINPREDARGAASELQNASDNNRFGDRLYQLSQIQLFTRDEYAKAQNRLALQTVHFEYGYELCLGVENNANTNGGKLTLKKLWFSYEKNQRASVSPYTFDYHQTLDDENPPYNTHKYDRWGNYTNSENYFNNINNPYVSQTQTKAESEKKAAVWSLKRITLPSGGTIDVDYESDDYAYVQNQTAMQMMPVSNGSTTEKTMTLQGNNRKVYFKLENSIPVGNLLAAQAEVKKYIPADKVLFFKIYMRVRKPTDTQMNDYVSGYADIAGSGIDENSIEDGKYTHGYVELAAPKVGGKTFSDYHPFSMAAWQYLRTSVPQLNTVGNFGDLAPNSSKAQKRAKVQSLINFLPRILTIFKGFYKHASDEKLGTQIADVDRSYIRLNSPDKIKYGGGIRVKQIILRDNWNSSTGTAAESDAVYGQVYDYTTQENGVTISSGVASYEPLMGGEENPFRKAKKYTEDIPFLTSNNLFFEEPANEQYFPGATVGYSKVTVKSLATHYARKEGTDDPYHIPAGILTTGAVVNEFYTAKDFPVITQQTPIQSETFNLVIPIPLIGQITSNRLTASQGYSIILNDMHGKPKRTSNYQQDNSGALSAEPISWVQYNYQAEAAYQNRTRAGYQVLTNKVTVLVSDRNGVAVTEDRILGQEHEFFTDMRENKTVSKLGGIHVNNELLVIAFIPIPLPLPWPTIGYSETQLRTAATNKIIHRSGILMSTEAYDGSSRVKTENKLFDAQTGQPVLTTVTNNFDDPIYNYTQLAHGVYDGMGAAYQNTGLQFTASVQGWPTGQQQYAIVLPSPLPDWTTQLVPGDEFIAGNSKAIYTEEYGNYRLFYFDRPPSSTTLTFTLVRSGKRNLLTASAGSITALKNPLERKDMSCTKTVSTITFTKTGGGSGGTGGSNGGSGGNGNGSGGAACICNVVCNEEMLRAINAYLRKYHDDTYPELSPEQDLFPQVLFNNIIPEYGPPIRSEALCRFTGEGKGFLHTSSTQADYSLQSIDIGIPQGSFPPDPYIIEVKTQGTNPAGFPLSIRNYFVRKDPDRPGEYRAINLKRLIQIDDICVNGLPQELPSLNFLSIPGNNLVSSTPFKLMGVEMTLQIEDDDAGRNIQTVKGYLVSNLYQNWTIFNTDSDCYTTGGGSSAGTGTGGSGFSNPLYEDIDESTMPITYKSTYIDRILSASAMTYNQNWIQDFLQTNAAGLQNAHGYANGNKGIWRPQASYVYVTERQQTAAEPAIKIDGAFDKVPLFDPENPILKECYPFWRKVNTMTRYSPYGYELENQDILGNYSAALYGYQGRLSTAVAANARQQEIGFESFEEYAGEIAQDNTAAGNIYVFTKSPTITKPVISWNTASVQGNEAVVILDRSVEGVVGGATIQIEGTYIKRIRSPREQENYIFIRQPFSGTYRIDWILSLRGKIILILNDFYNPARGNWEGTLRVAVTRNIEIPTTPTVFLDNTTAHTGKQSLRLTATNTFIQPKLALEEKKQYFFSAWVKAATVAPVKSTYATTGTNRLSVQVKTSNNVTFTFEPVGSIIEGWQKVEGTFTMPIGATGISLVFNPGTYSTVYLDDVRICPEKAAMKTYVYNTKDYKLRAVLDDNNFSQLYYYDFQGNLFLTKRETERGIETIQESMGHQRVR